jgi:SHS2 domain-containing protein
MFKTVEHTADIAVELTATNRLGLYSAAIQALIFLLTGAIAKDKSDQNDPMGENGCLELGEKIHKCEFGVHGFDDEELLIRLMNEFLFQCQTESRYPIRLDSIEANDEHELQVKFSYTDIEGDSPFIKEFKAATYNELHIKQSPLWFARVVLDV